MSVSFYKLFFWLYDLFGNKKGVAISHIESTRNYSLWDCFALHFICLESCKQWEKYWRG
ncbi:hypothetical protein CHCC20335_2487 [Bacillus paralicheniformis]|nr:hypothetical protein CHCC20335_2487 [Bacillus paralicheniformis]